MDVCSRITGKDYENANSTPVMNIDGIVDRLGYAYNSSLRKASSMWDIHLLHKNNVEQFKTYWGRQSCCWTGYERFWIWKHEFENCDIYVMAAPVRGTSYEVAITGNKDAAVIEVVNFHKRLLNNLRADNKDVGLTG